MIIKTAGYLWHRKYIDWTRRRLVGLDESNSKGSEVNFAYQSGIYGLYDSNHNCIYIGQAGKGEDGLFDRLKAHALDDHLFCFWERFTWFGFYSPEQLRNNDYPDSLAKSVILEGALNTIESVSIYLALPRFNRRYESGFDGVLWYYQAAEYEDLKDIKKR
jgi:hypothetical protein